MLPAKDEAGTLGLRTHKFLPVHEMFCVSVDVMITVYNNTGWSEDIFSHGL